MVDFTISGFGTHAITPGTDRLFIRVVTRPVGVTIGGANPENLYQCGLLRFAVDSWWGPVHAIDGDNVYLDIAADIDQVGYGIFDGGVVQISEDSPGPPPSSGASVLTNSTFPSATFTDTEDINIGQTFQVNHAGATFIGIRYYRPPADTTGSTLTFRLWHANGVDEAAGPWTFSVAPGWNEWDVTPVPLASTDTYTIVVHSFAGVTRPAGSGQWSAASTLDISTFGGNWSNGPEGDWPSGLNDGDWFGPDIVVAWP